MNSLHALLPRALRRALLIITTLVFSTGTPADAQNEVPLKGSAWYDAVTIVDEPGVRWIIEGTFVGTATHVGHYTGTFRYVIELETGAVTGEVAARAANGDEFGGPVAGRMTEAGIAGEVIINRGTGRFANASGVAQFQSDLHTAEFDGAITYAASDRRRRR